jgi:hypothetical protein
LPLFHGSREVAVSAVPMMVSHRVEGLAECAYGSWHDTLAVLARRQFMARRVTAMSRELLN